MAAATYETVLEQAQRLTPKEQMRLREDLAASAADAHPRRGSGFALVTFLRSIETIDPAALDTTERAI